MLLFLKSLLLIYVLYWWFFKNNNLLFESNMGLKVKYILVYHQFESSTWIWNKVRLTISYYFRAPFSRIAAIEPHVKYAIIQHLVRQRDVKMRSLFSHRSLRQKWGLEASPFLAKWKPIGSDISLESKRNGSVLRRDSRKRLQRAIRVLRDVVYTVHLQVIQDNIIIIIHLIRISRRKKRIAIAADVVGSRGCV